MTAPDFSQFDGSGRTPRDAQKKVLDELASQWDKWDVFAITTPTGGGKSYLARAIQKATDAAYITSTNILVDQYTSEYHVNRFVGADHFSSAAAYDSAKMTALDPENHTAYNPCSFKVAQKHKEFRHPDVIVFDECFPDKTWVLLADGTRKKIDVLSVGDSVMAYNETDRQFAPKRVSWIGCKKSGHPIVEVKSTGAKLLCTSNHPILTTRGWVDAEDLLPGDRLVAKKVASKGNVPLSPSQFGLEVLMGLMLGDGAFENPRGSKYLYLLVRHGEKQEEYLRWLAKIFGDSEVTTRKNGGYNKEKNIMSFATSYLDTPFPAGKKASISRDLLETYLTPVGLAIWVMDDGSKQHNMCQIHYCRFDEETRKNIREVLERKFDIRGYEQNHDGYPKLILDTENYRKLARLSAQYFHPCMRYKLPSGDWQPFDAPDTALDPCVYPEVTRVTKTNKYPRVWDLTVEDFHTFCVASDRKTADMYVVHNCDQALSLLQSLATAVVPLAAGAHKKRELTVPANAAQYILQCCAEKRAKATEKEQQGKRMDARRTMASAMRLEDLAEALIEEPERFAIHIEEKQCKFGMRRSLHIAPTFLPKTVAKNFFKRSKIILLSATLLPSDVFELTGGTPFHKIETPSPIPPDRRRIYLKPCEEPLSYPVNYDMLAAKLDEILTELPGLSTLIHVTYADAEALERRMKHPVMVHDKQTKQEAVDDWIKSGGVLLASGCSTGLDLRHDMCRLNIVSKLLFASTKSDLVQKRLALPGGKRAYNLATMRELVQAAGRSTRSESDWSVTLVLDGRFPRLYKDCKEDLPASFRDAIIWQDTSYDELRKRIEEMKQ